MGIWYLHWPSLGANSWQMVGDSGVHICRVWARHGGHKILQTVAFLTTFAWKLPRSPGNSSEAIALQMWLHPLVLFNFSNPNWSLCGPQLHPQWTLRRYSNYPKLLQDKKEIFTAFYLLEHLNNKVYLRILSHLEPSQTQRETDPQTESEKEGKISLSRH